MTSKEKLLDFINRLQNNTDNAWVDFRRKPQDMIDDLELDQEALDVINSGSMQRIKDYLEIDHVTFFFFVLW